MVTSVAPEKSQHGTWKFGPGGRVTPSVHLARNDVDHGVVLPAPAAVTSQPGQDAMPLTLDTDQAATIVRGSGIPPAMAAVRAKGGLRRFT